jgi:hypothetical protein
MNDKGNGYVGNILGVDTWVTSNCPAGSTAGDKSGAMFSKGECIGFVVKRRARTEFQRDASARLTECVVTARYAYGELFDSYGVPLISKDAYA